MGAAPLKRTGSKRSKSAERRAFEQLPKGWKVPDAIKMMDQSEAAVVQKQALQQAARFEVLRKEDVDNLSQVRGVTPLHMGLVHVIDYLFFTGTSTSR